MSVESNALLVGLVNAGVLRMADLIARNVFRVDSLYRSLSELEETEKLKVIGDKEKFQQVVKALGEISKSGGDEAEKTEKLISYLHGNEQELEEVQVSTSASGYQAGASLGS